MKKHMKEGYLCLQTRIPALPIMVPEEDGIRSYIKAAAF